MLNPETRQSLEKLLGRKKLTTHPVELVTYEVDAGLDRGRPDALALPQSAGDVVKLVRWAKEHDVPLIARGAGTGLSGGAVAERGGIIVAFSRMNRLLELDEQSRTAMVEPGMVNLTLDTQLRQKGWYFPPDPASQRSSTLGGNIAENAGGPHCFKYGVTTNYVLGLNVALADGRHLLFGGRALDYPEYDLVGLLVGSEGTLGIITSAIVRIVRHPPGVKTMMAVFDSVEQAGAAVSAVIAAGLVPATMEMMDKNITRIIEDYAHAGLPRDADAVLIIEVDGYPAGLDAQIEEVADILQANAARHLRIAQTAEERDRLWYARKSAAGAITRLAPSYYLVDITVQRSKLASALAECKAICQRYDLETGHVFHAGDGNLHPLILIPNPNDRDLMARVLRAGQAMVEVGVRFDGSISGEHGIGIEKRAYMADMYSAAELSAMWDVKEVFDPHQRMNPGKVFPTKMPAAPRPRGEVDLRGDIFTPKSAEEAARLFAALSAQKRPTHIRAPTADGRPPTAVSPLPSAVISTAALTGIKTYSRDDLYVTVGAGTRLAEIQAFLARDKMQVPMASPWQAATIGGIVSTNANAPLRMRYGGLRDLVLALTVVLGDGRVIRAGRPVVKNVAGYDLPKVFIGAHGTLGLIVDVTLKLTPLPRARRTLIVPVEDLARGLELARLLTPVALVASGIVVGAHHPKSETLAPHAFRSAEVRTPKLVYTAEGIAEDVRAELEEVRQALHAAGAAEPLEVESPTATELWTEFLAGTANALQIRAGVPAKNLAELHKRANVGASGDVFVDAANGLLYTAVDARNAESARTYLEGLRRAARELGGYAVVTHAPEELRSTPPEGDPKGSPRLDRWGYQPDSLDLMRALKARYDPAGILNVGEFVGC